MPFLDIIADKYSDDTRDYTLELMSHRHFEYVLSEAYECKILCNPWLAASTAAKQSAPEPAASSKEAPPLRATGSKDSKGFDPESEYAMKNREFKEGYSHESESGNQDKSSAEGERTAQGSSEAPSGGSRDTTEDIDVADTLVAMEATMGHKITEKPSVEEPPAGAADKASSMSQSCDATFGASLREKFFEAAKVIRHTHGVEKIKEPGEDPQLDYLVNEVMLTYQRLKVRLLKASNQEAQFRLDLETRVAQGIWNQYDVNTQVDGAKGSRGRGGDFVVYQPGSPPHTPRNSKQQQQQWPVGMGSSSPPSAKQAGGRQQQQHYPPVSLMERAGRERTVEAYRVDRGLDLPGRAGGVSGRSSLKMSADAKRTASGKFEKNQVQPLTEWLLKHSSNPYPSMDDKAELARESGLSTQQVQNWFINMRKRHWTPMMNGKRRPRTFLDYVILSSQQGDKDSPGKAAFSGKLVGRDGPDHMMGEDYDYAAPLDSYAFEKKQPSMPNHQHQAVHHSHYATRTSNRLNTLKLDSFIGNGEDEFENERW